MARDRSYATKSSIFDVVLESKGLVANASDIIHALAGDGKKKVGKRDLYRLLGSMLGKELVERKDPKNRKKYKKDYTPNLRNFEGLRSILQLQAESKKYDKRGKEIGNNAGSEKYGREIGKSLDLVFAVCFVSPYGDLLNINNLSDEDISILVKRTALETTLDWNRLHPEEKVQKENTNKIHSLKDFIDDDFIGLVLNKAREIKGIVTTEDKLSYIVAFFDRETIKHIHESSTDPNLSYEEFCREWNYILNGFKVKPLNYLTLAFRDTSLIWEDAENSQTDTIRLCFDLIVEQALNHDPDKRLMSTLFVDPKRYIYRVGSTMRELKDTPMNEVAFELEAFRILSISDKKSEPFYTELSKIVRNFDTLDFSAKLGDTRKRNLIKALKLANLPPAGNSEEIEKLDSIEIEINLLKEQRRIREFKELTDEKGRLRRFLLALNSEIIRPQGGTEEDIKQNTDNQMEYVIERQRARVNGKRTREKI